MEDGRIWRKILACDRYVAAVGGGQGVRWEGGSAFTFIACLPPSVRPHAIEGG